MTQHSARGNVQYCEDALTWFVGMGLAESETVICARLNGLCFTLNASYTTSLANQVIDAEQ
jgi:hypothetical protein